MKSWIAFILCLAGSIPLLAQRYLDMVSQSYTYSFGMTEKVSDSPANVGRFGTQVTLPIKRDNGDVWLTGFIYGQVQFQYEDETVPDKTFQPLTLKFGYRRDLGDNRTLTFMALPKISSNWSGLNSKHFQWGGIGLYSFRLDADTRVQLGLYANTEFFGPLIVPLTGLDYTGFKRWEFTGVLPVHYTVAYLPGEKWRVGGYFQAIVESYYYENNGREFYMEHSPQDLFLFAEYALTPFVWLRGRVGHSVFRNWQLYDIDDRMTARLAPVRFGNDRADPFEDLTDSPIVQLSLLFRYDLRED